MSQSASIALQQQIARELEVAETFDAEREIERRVAFLTERLVSTGLRSLVLGISGGVDSTTAGRLCQLAVERAREAGHQAEFHAMRLPYGVQADERDAQLALAFIRADQVLTVDVKPASDAALEASLAAGVVFRDAHHRDFVHGNIKARQRMIAQYAVAGATGGLVVGTDHAAEAVSGFFTKFGDGAADLVPLTGLTKRRVRAVADLLGAPAELVWKTPTADLEDLDPGKADEDALGVTYDEIDDFLEGKPVDERAFGIIAGRYEATAHKRELPIAP
ncbi:ammonia-dependent NAD(+) synthetase [Streptomyces sp. NPDC089799]|uniref:ammonia-dependent NAD(+) synthetase n=1 Tax=Streptomyces sp. NPDC089799 TaxID=3155066 RepID=UPI00342FE88D